MKRNLWILRGCSGSGKSFLAKELAGEDGQIFSADDYFMKDGKYKFNPSEISLAHVWNQQRILNAIVAQVPDIIIDNTNITLWEMRQLKTIVSRAKENGYNVEIKTPNTPWAFDAEELTKRNQHGVPLSIIQKKLRQFVPNITVDDILEKVPAEEK